MMERKHVLQSDNLAFVDFEFGRAALKFIRDLEAGTAVIAMPDRHGVMTEKNDGIGFYEALAGSLGASRPCSPHRPTAWTPKEEGAAEATPHTAKRTSEPYEPK